MKNGTPKGYEEACQRLAAAFQAWIARESETRLVDLRWRDWGNVCYAGTLEDICLDILCESDDAKAMVRYADDATGNECTLLMAYVIAEMMGLRTKGKGSPPILPAGYTVQMPKKGVKPWN